MPDRPLSPWIMRFVPLLLVWWVLSGFHSLPLQASVETSAAQAPSQDVTPTPTPPLSASSVDAAWAAWDALAPNLQAKVDGRILDEIRGEVLPAHLGKAMPPTLDRSVASRIPQPLAQTRFIVYLQEATDISALDERVYASQADRRSALVDSLRANAERSQSALRQLLTQRSAARGGANPAVSGFQPFFIVNAIAVEGDLSTLVELARRGDVRQIVANYPLIPSLQATDAAEEEGQTPTGGQADAANRYYWNLEKVEADRVHTDLGIRGAGAVVGGFDTGVNYRHPALLRQYRGNQNGVIDHNYNWFVPDSNLYPNGNLGRSVTDVPSDCAFSTHGTHTMGTMVGEGSGNAPTIGMAPDARWIAVPGICGDTMPGGIRDDIGGIKAFQWFLCPTDLTGNLASADCSKAPDVINSSWGSANPADDTFRPILQVLRAAGVAPVFAAGNPSAGLGSIGTPANAPEAITVGATTEYDNLAYFSAQGPSIHPGEQKPELSAPGTYVRSSVGSSGYDEYSGTSMAAPHVAGLIALLVSLDLEDGVRDFDVDDLERLMTLSAVDLGEPGPDDLFGYGRIDAYAALQLGKTAGDLRGQIFDKEYNRPLASVLIEAHQPGTQRRFRAQTDATGVYSLTLPAGEYQVTLSRWGYDTTDAGRQRVVAGALSLVDFRMLSRPQATISGQVKDARGPVANALIYAPGNPSLQSRSGADGKYQIGLPLGAGELVVEAPQHRLLRQPVQTPGVGAQVNFTLKRAPSILLVDTSPLGGWFLGWPVYRFFTRALDEQNYQYNLWRIQYSDFSDTKIGPDGSTLYGLPSAASLKAYDVVIWIQSYCANASCTAGSPAEIGAEAAIIDFLDNGGRLFISGQDLGYADRVSKLFNVYLQARYVADSGGYEGQKVRGSDFLGGLDLELTNASLYNYANGVLLFSPDVVAPRPGGYAFPVLRYDNEDGAAALAVAPCNASYRAFYLAAGFENLAPRAYQAQPDWTRLLDASITWLSGEERTDRYFANLSSSSESREVGEQAVFEFSIVNLSDVPMRFAIGLQNGRWSAQVSMGGVPVASPVELPPCSSTNFEVTVDVPYAALLGDQDTAKLTIASLSHPSLTSYEWELQSRNIAQWQVAEVLPANSYGMSVIPLLENVHVVGGAITSGSDYARADHFRFDSCTATWESRAPLPQPRMFAASAADGERLFVAGGVTSFNDPPSNTFYIYDSKSDSWSEGVPMPRGVSWATAAFVDGRFFVFGGSDGLEAVANFYAYDPATNQWQDMGEMPGGSQFLAAATVSNGEVYIVGGAPYGNAALRYDPIANSWSGIFQPIRSRYGAALLTAPDGSLFLLGGDGGGSLVERYDLTTGYWSEVNYILEESRFFSGAAFVDGKIHLVGGFYAGISHESLRLNGSFCESALRDQQTAVGVNGDIAYTLELRSTDRDQTNARLIAPLHPNQRFAGFSENGIGAVYSANHAVAWSGTIPANSPPLRLSYTASLRDGAWQPGDRITHTVQLDNGSGRNLTRSSAAQIFVPDFSASTKQVGSAAVAAGVPVTYTVNLRSSTPVGGPAAFTDPLPASLVLDPDSLRPGNGALNYNASTHTIEWSGLVGGSRVGFANLTDGYVWSDTLGDGVGFAPRFAWRDIRSTGLPVVSGVGEIACDQPIGFAFPFFGADYASVCVDVSGQIAFGDYGHYATTDNLCPLPTDYNYIPRIAALWSSLAVDDAVYMQTFGVAPNRYTIIQWTDAHYWSSWDQYLGITRDPDTDFQIVLHEDGRVQLHILRIGSIIREISTTGLASPSATQSVTYQCNRSRPGLGDQMTVEFLPPGGLLSASGEPVSFQMIAKEGTPANSIITNTVFIRSGQESYTRTVGLLVQSVDLASSTKAASRTELLPGESVAYTITLRNTGLAPAQQATLSDRLPAGLTYNPASLACSSGVCNESGGLITWQGSLLPGDGLTVTYAATLNAVLTDRAPLTNTARIDAVGVSDLRRSAVVYARSTNLSASRFDFGNRPIEPGDRFTLAVLLHNTGKQNANADFSLLLPGELSYVAGTLSCGVGNCRTEAGRILWSGSLPPRGLVELRLDVRLAEGLVPGQRVRLSGEITDSTWGQTQPVVGDMFAAFHTFAPLMIDGRKPPVFLPLVGNAYQLPSWVLTPVPTVTPIPASPLPTPTPSGR